jgi:hypothetical protein
MNLAWRAARLPSQPSRKIFEDVCASILACELAADVRENALDTRAMEVVDRERRLAE